MQARHEGGADDAGAFEKEDISTTNKSNLSLQRGKRGR
jgi:hypothetical protein